MFGKLFQQRASETSQVEAVQHFPSPGGNRPGISSVPYLVYGHEAPAIANMVASCTTIGCLAVQGLDNLAQVLDGRPFNGFQAMSPQDSPGEAGKAIALFHAGYPQGMALYAAWGYHVGRSIQRAIGYGAQGVMMPGIDAQEMLTYLIHLGQLHENGNPAPRTVEEHVALLSKVTPNSPFWQMQDRPDPTDY